MNLSKFLFLDFLQPPKSLMVDPLLSLMPVNSDPVNFTCNWNCQGSPRAYRPISYKQKMQMQCSKKNKKKQTNKQTNNAFLLVAIMSQCIQKQTLPTLLSVFFAVDNYLHILGCLLSFFEHCSIHSFSNRTYTNLR